jgi:hypothetical protein
MKIDRFFIPVERVGDKERIFKKKKGRKLRFGYRRKLKKIETLKDILVKEKGLDRTMNKLYQRPLAEGVLYNLTETHYFLKTGLKKNVRISGNKITCHHISMDGTWLNLMFRYTKISPAYLFRFRWWLGTRRTRKELAKKRAFQKHFTEVLGIKRKISNVKKILGGGVPVRIENYRKRSPVGKEQDICSVLYFLRKRHFLERKKERQDLLYAVLPGFAWKWKKRKKKRKKAHVVWSSNSKKFLIEFKRGGYICRN